MLLRVVNPDGQYAVAPFQVGGTADPHAYFNTLVARPDHWLSRSLRNEAQIESLRRGGPDRKMVTYDAGMDAAKAVIPAVFYDPELIPAGRRLQEAINATQTVIRFTYPDSLGNGVGVAIGAEVMEVVRPSGYKPSLNGNQVTVIRGTDGTVAAPHALDSLVGRTGNSLLGSAQVLIPLGTVTGNRYLFTWDNLYTSSYLRRADLGEVDWLKNHKAMQFESAGGSIWQEVATRFSSSGNAPSPNPLFDNTTHVAEFDWRSYQPVSTATSYDPLQPTLHHAEVTRNYPLRPCTAVPLIHADVWWRIWVHFDMQPNDYDVMDVWYADETQAPVHTLQAVKVKAYRIGKGDAIRDWFLELNTSDGRHRRRDFRDLVSYHRNFAALINPPADWSALRVQPIGGIPA